MLQGLTDFDVCVKIPQTGCFIVVGARKEAVVLKQAEGKDTAFVILQNGSLLPSDGVEYRNGTITGPGNKLLLIRGPVASCAILESSLPVLASQILIPSFVPPVAIFVVSCEYIAANTVLCPVVIRPGTVFPLSTSHTLTVPS